MTDQPQKENKVFNTINNAKYVTEFIGTMFLVLIVKLAATSSNPLTPLAIGFGLMILIYQFGWASGAHLNPAVTTAVAIRNKGTKDALSFGEIIMYMISQFVGGFIGGLFSFVIGGFKAVMLAPSPNLIQYTLSEAFMAELFFTFFLTFVVLHVATYQNGNQFYGFVIGCVVFVSIVCMGNISGCVLNPAVWFGLISSAFVLVDNAGRNSIHAQYIWLYVLSEFLAAFLSGVLFRLVYVPMINAKQNLTKTASNQGQTAEPMV